ncbi:MAG TPA: extracellular solute-binding protein, partial [Acidimicrobiia bacterium]
MSLRRRIILLAVMPALIAAACSGSADPTTTTTTTFAVVTTMPPTTPTTAVIEPPPVSGTLTVWADPSLADAVRSRAVLFTADTGVEVTVVPTPEADILPAVLDGSVELPDVFIGPHTWVYQLAVAGITEPVTLGDDLPAGIVEAVSLRTFPLGVPLAVDALIQVRNPSLVATRPTAAESISCQGCFVLPADGAFDVTYPFATTLGGYLFGPDPDNGYDPTITGVDSEEAIAAATVLETLVAAGVVTTATDRDEVLARFAAGEAGIIWAGPEAIGILPGEAVESLPTIGDAAAVSP